MQVPKGLDGLSHQIAVDVYKKIGNKIAKDMTHQYVSVIKSFYDDYKPHVYQRKYRSYYFADPQGVKAYSKFVKLDADKKGFTIELKVSPDNITAPYSSLVNGKGTRSLTNLVFMNTWVRGQHGGVLPWSIIPEDKRPLHPVANSWKAIDGDFYWQPPVMKKSPMQQMDEWFSWYATNENLDKVIEPIVSSAINRYLRRWDKRYGQ